MNSVTLILSGVLFTTATSYFAGLLLLRLLRLKFPPIEHRVFAFFSGSALLSILVFLLSTVHYARFSAFAVLACGIAAITTSLRDRKQIAIPNVPSRPVKTYWIWLTFAITLPFLWLYLINAMAPETSSDGMAYHLGLIARYDRAHGFERIPTSMFANIPQGLEMLFFFAFTVGKHSAAALVHFSFLLALAFAILAYGRRFQLRFGGVVAALLLFTTSVVGKDAVTAYNDVAEAAVVFVAFYLVQLWDTWRRKELLILCGICAGFAFTIKYPAVLMVLFIAGRIVWSLRRQFTPMLHSITLFTVSTAAIASPWLIKNMLWIGNPVAPVLNSVFANPYYTPDGEKDLDRILWNWQGLKLTDLPLEMTIHGSRGSGIVGPLFLLSPLLLFALRSPQGRWLLSTGLCMALPVIADKGTRFLIPAVPFVALAFEIVLPNLAWLASAVVLFHAGASWPSISRLYADPFNPQITGIPWRAALRLIPEEEYLRATSPAYNLARMVERTVPSGHRVFAFNFFPAAYCSREVLVSWWSTETAALQQILLTPLLPEFQPNYQFAFHFPERTASGIRLTQTGRGSGVWSLNEVQCKHRGTAIPNSSDWRFNAFPYPWTAGLAMDHLWITRWRSNQDLSPGQRWETTFNGHPHPVDEIDANVSSQPVGLRLSAQIQTEAGDWQEASATPVLTQLPLRPDLRKEATAEFLAQGIRFVLIQPGDLCEEDITANPSAWNLSLVAKASGAHLFRIVASNASERY